MNDFASTIFCPGTIRHDKAMGATNGMAATQARNNQTQGTFRGISTPSQMSSRPSTGLGMGMGTPQSNKRQPAKEPLYQMSQKSSQLDPQQRKVLSYPLPIFI